MSRKAMTPAQAKVMRVLRKGGLIRWHLQKSGRRCYRVLDINRNPLYNVQARTVEALKSSERIIQEEGVWISNPVTRFYNSKTIKDETEVLQ